MIEVKIVNLRMMDHEGAIADEFARLLNSGWSFLSMNDRYAFFSKKESPKITKGK